MKRQENEQMRDAILDAVIACKMEAEGAAISLCQISSKAGISERTLTRYFPDKELLIYTAAVRYLRQLYESFAQQFLAADTAEMDGAARLEYLIRLQAENYRKDTTSAKIFVRAFTTTMYTAVYRHLPSSGHDTATRDLVIACVEDGIRDGSIRSDISPLDTYFAVSACFVGMVQRLVYIYSVDMPQTRHEETILSVLDRFITLLMESLRSKNRSLQTK